MALPSFPILIKAKESEIEEYLRTGNVNRALETTMQAFKKTTGSRDGRVMVLTMRSSLLRNRLIYFHGYWFASAAPLKNRLRRGSPTRINAVRRSGIQQSGKYSS